jgi:hypothetical protein
MLQVLLVSFLILLLIFQLIYQVSFLLSSTKVSKNIDFEEFSIEYSSFETELKEENMFIFSSPDIEKCFSLDSLEYFPTLGFATPLSVKNFAAKEVGTSYPSQTLPSSSETQPPIVKTKPPLHPFLPLLLYIQSSLLLLLVHQESKIKW